MLAPMFELHPTRDLLENADNQLVTAQGVWRSKWAMTRLATGCPAGTVKLGMSDEFTLVAREFF